MMSFDQVLLDYSLMITLTMMKVSLFEGGFAAANLRMIGSSIRDLTADAKSTSSFRVTQIIQISQQDIKGTHSHTV